MRQRTRELQYKVKELEVKELEGKDRIAHHMLSVNSLEETLELILQIIADIIEMDKAVVYLLDGYAPNAVAAIVIATVCAALGRGASAAGGATVAGAEPPGLRRWSSGHEPGLGFWPWPQWAR